MGSYFLMDKSKSDEMIRNFSRRLDIVQTVVETVKCTIKMKI